MRSIFWTVVFVFVFAGVCSAQSLLYFPQVANGIQGSTQWTTAVVLTNTAAPGTPSAAATLTFTQDNSTPLTVTLFDEQNRFLGTGDSFSFQIAGAQTKFFFSNGAGTLTQGFATVSSSGSVTGSAVFFEGVVNGGLISQAGVLPANALTRQGIFAIQDDSVTTAVAIANPGSTNANVTLQLLDTAGGSSFPSVIRSLAAHNHTCILYQSALLRSSDTVFWNAAHYQ